MDFTLDTLASGRRFRTLNIVDDFTRECLAIEVDTSLGGSRVVRVLDRLLAHRGRPTVIVCDNGPEFAGRTLDAWAYGAGVKIHFIRPGKPVENCYVESFNGKFRDQCLNDHWFLSLDDARTKIETWRRDYNEVKAAQLAWRPDAAGVFINRRTRRPEWTSRGGQVRPSAICPASDSVKNELSAVVHVPGPHAQHVALVFENCAKECARVPVMRPRRHRPPSTLEAPCESHCLRRFLLLVSGF